MSTYLWIDLAILFIPLLFSFEKRVRFCRYYLPLFVSIFFVSTIYIFWDMAAAARGDWAFNAQHILGVQVLGLPIEEILFFVVVPYSCLFTYEVISHFAYEKTWRIPVHLWGILPIFFILLSVPFKAQAYTSTVLLFSALITVSALFLTPHLLNSRRYWIFIMITTGLFLVFNTVLTSIPVVIYDPQAFSQIRVFTIPLEDFFYSWSMLTFYLVVYTFLKSRIFGEKHRIKKLKEVIMETVKEIKSADLDSPEFIQRKVNDIRGVVGEGVAINALSGGVDSSVVTLLGHKALGEKLKTYFIENGLMRKDEAQRIVALFKDLGVTVEVIDAKEQFFSALKGITDPEEKREAITQTFYKNVFGKLVRESGAKYLLQGTILTDIDETVAGIKRQHNVFEQLGIDPQKAFGYKIIEPVVQLRKDGVRKVGEALGLPESVFKRMPFPGPALAARVIGEASPARIEIVRQATDIVENELNDSGAFQVMAILHEDRVTGMRDGKRDFGLQIEIRCWNSVDARTATPARLSFETLENLAKRMTEEIRGVVSVTYHIATKPPSTMEAV